MLALCSFVILGCASTLPTQPDAALTASRPVPGLNRPTVLSLPAWSGPRNVRIYLPPGYHQSSRRYPVLYLNDGQNLFDDSTTGISWGVDTALNTLAQSGILELIVVGIDHGAARRTTEFNPWDNPRFGPGEGRRYLDFVVRTVKPMVDAGYRTQPEREHTGIMGSSLGGLITQYAVLEYPQVFGKAAIFSPAFWVAPEVFALTADRHLAADTRIALYVGSAEGEEAVDDYRRMRSLLQDLGHPANQLWTRLTPGGVHQESAWRAVFPEVVTWLFELTP